MIKNPISGLVEFAQDIKPYHTKIIEVLVDYIYEETMNVKVDDEMSMDVKTDLDFHSEFCPEGYGVPPWGNEYTRGLDSTVDIGSFPADTNFDGVDDTTIQLGFIITDAGPVFQVNKIVQPNRIYIPNDHTGLFPIESTFSIVNTFNNDGMWKVISSQYDIATNQTVVNVEFFSNRISLKMFAAFSSSWFPEGFLWIDLTNPDFNKKSKIYSSGWWWPFSGPDGLFSNPLIDPSFVFDVVQPVGVVTGSYWFNTNTEVLRYFNGSSWVVVSSENYYQGTDPYNVRAKRNVMYVTGKASKYFSAGQDFKIVESTHFHNGRWLITKVCDDVAFSELTVQHVTDTTADGTIYTSISTDPTPHWPTGLYWYDTSTSQLKIWDGGTWAVPVYPFVVSSVTPLSPNYNDLWYYTTNNELFEYNGTSWVKVDNDYVIIGPTPHPDAQGPRYSDDGLIITNTTPSYDIFKVDALTQPLIANNEYSTFNLKDGCLASTGILDPLSPSAAFYINGEHSGDFFVGQTFIIRHSTGNDGVWKIQQINYNIFLDATVLTCLFDSISTIDDTTTGNPNELFQTWDSVFGFGLGGMDLDLPLTSGRVDAYVISNYDFPEVCPFVSPTTAFTKIKESFQAEVTLPYAPISVNIVAASVNTPSASGKFVIANPNPGSGNYEKFFVPSSVFVIQGSGNNDGLWTVMSSSYDAITNQTTVYPVENVPRIPPEENQSPTVVRPFGYIVAEFASFNDVISADIKENALPSSWEFFYYSAPTTPIYDIDTVSNTLLLNGDVRRFFNVGSKLTIQQSKRSTGTYPFVETVNEGAWVWTLVGKTYNNVTKITTLSISEPLTDANVQKGTVSGQPTWLMGVGWDQAGWSEEADPWMNLANHQMLTGGDLTSVASYDMFITPQGQFDQLYFDIGEFDSILQQILPS